MGAQSFIHTGKGDTVQDAFASARDKAAWDYGHGGYTGSLAEKDSFVLIPIPSEWEGTPEQYVNHLFQQDDPRIEDKWGPAGAVEIAPKTWIFFGYASS